MNKPFKPQTPLLDLDLLRSLVAIAETGNFSAAASVVLRTPSAVSMQVKRMEELLGRPIFLRDSRSVTLTDDGEVLLVHARRVLALNQQIMAKFMTPDVSGVVRMGTFDHAAEQFLPRVLRRFSDTHPSVVVDITMTDSTDLLEKVNQNKLDIVIVACTEQKLKANDIEVLYYEKLVWAGLKGGIAFEQDPLPVSVWEEGCVWRESALKGLKGQGRDFRVTFKSAHIAGQKAGILAGMAIAPLPLSTCGGQIIALDPSLGLPELPDYALGMMIVKDASAPVRAVADHLRASFDT